MKQKELLKLHNYIQSTNYRLRKIYKYSFKDVDTFWQFVYRYQLDHPELEFESIVNDKIKNKFTDD